MAVGPVLPTTSQPPPGDFRRLYQILASHHPGVVSIHLTAWASGTFQAAESAAARTNASAPVFAMDSRNASIGQGLVALRAAELAATGMDVETLVTRLDAVISATRCWALLGSVRHAVRGGRVPAAMGWLARALRLEPILASFPDGRLAVNGALAGRRNRAARFARWVSRRIPRRDGGPWRLAVGHAHAPSEADALLAALCARVQGVDESFVTEIGTALGAHGGPGTLVVAVQPLGVAGD
jgi:DegV family protein with EDD domain